MIDFTDLNKVKKIDPQNTLGSTDLALKQCQTAWQEVKQIELPNIGNKIKNIVFCGMGASIYGALVIKALMGEKFSYPIEFISDYNLPNFVNQETLVVLTSYSGTTEEVLSCANEAKEKNTQILILTKGGQLAEFAKNNNFPAYIFDGKLNPAGVPRLGNGYTIIGLLGLFFKMGLINLNENLIETSFTTLGEKMIQIKEKAIIDSEIFVNKIPIVFAAEHLTGNGQILRNQFNETSKVFSALFLIPDLNHHLMEGLQFPKNSGLYFIIFNSNNYSSKIKKRVFLTKQVVEQNGHQVFEIKTTGNNIVEDFLEVLFYGSYLTLYLGLRYNQNPAVNPWVDYFKSELAK